MKFQQWPKRDPDKNYFKVPNEVFHIGLSYPEISIYCYLLSIEDRETYQCYPSYIRLTPAQTETALRNALRYIPVELHEQLAPELTDELLTRGKIYGTIHIAPGSVC